MTLAQDVGMPAAVRNAALITTVSSWLAIPALIVGQIVRIVSSKSAEQGGISYAAGLFMGSTIVAVAAIGLSIYAVFLARATRSRDRRARRRLLVCAGIAIAISLLAAPSLLLLPIVFTIAAASGIGMYTSGAANAWFRADPAKSPTPQQA